MAKKWTSGEKNNREDLTNQMRQIERLDVYADNKYSTKAIECNTNTEGCILFRKEKWIVFIEDIHS